jgi:hypothetical protein
MGSPRWRWWRYAGRTSWPVSRGYSSRWDHEGGDHGGEWATAAPTGVRAQPAPDATYRRRPTANPSSAPPTTTTMITIRMNLPIPARKPRASSSAASRPAWAAATITAINGKASCAAALPQCRDAMAPAPPCPRHHHEHSDQDQGTGKNQRRLTNGSELRALHVPYRADTHGLSRLFTVNRNRCSKALSCACHVVPKL